MGLEGLAARLGDLKGSVGFAADETFLALYVAHLFERAGVAGQIAVGKVEQGLERGEVDRLVDHQHRHDAKASLAFEGFVEVVDRDVHGVMGVICGWLL